MNMNRREKLLIIILAAVVVLLGGYKFLIDPQIKKTLASFQANDQAREGKKQSEDIENSIIKQSADNAAKRAKVSKKTDRYFPEIEADNMHVFFQNLANNAGVSYDTFTMTPKVITQIAVLKPNQTVTAYPAKDAADKIKNGGASSTAAKAPAKNASTANPGNKAPNDLLEMMTVSFQFQSSYQNTLNLIDEINKCGRLVRITSLDMSKVDQETAGNVEISVTITTECYGIAKMDEDVFSIDNLQYSANKANPFAQG